MDTYKCLFYKEKQLYKEQNVDSLFLPRIVIDEKTMLPIK